MGSTVTQIIEAKSRQLGAFGVRRALPTAKCRSVGPFVFLDQMGPEPFVDGVYLDVPPHPHIGLSTLTWVLEGELDHRDSLGSVQTIRPGEVNWMTAGAGIVHSERTPAHHRTPGARFGGLQAWIALPQGDEETAPSFQHYPAADIPTRQDGDTNITLIAGSAWGMQSPVTVFSETLYADIAIAAGGSVILPDVVEERAVYPLSGSIRLDGTAVAPGSLAVLQAGASVHVEAQSDARMVLIGGAPLDGPRVIDWNFVSSSRARIEQAKADWRDRRFPTVPGETEFTPLPSA